jgi:hypothetical protein
MSSRAPPTAEEFRKSHFSETELARSNLSALSEADETRLSCNEIVCNKRSEHPKDIDNYKKCLNFKNSKCDHIILKKNGVKYVVLKDGRTQMLKYIFPEDNKLIQLPDEYWNSEDANEKEFAEADSLGLTFGGKSKKSRKSRKSRKH